MLILVCNALGKRVGILTRLRDILPEYCLNRPTIYNTIIQALIDYGPSIYGVTGSLIMLTLKQSRKSRILLRLLVTGNVIIAQASEKLRWQLEAIVNVK